MNISNFCEATESYVFSGKDYVQYFYKWKPGKNNILFITGLSGSGKSTMAEKYAKDNNATHVEIDIFEFAHDLPDNIPGMDLVNKSKEKFPDYKKALEAKWKNEDGTEMSDDEVVPLLDKAAKYALSICKKDKSNLYVFEGLQIFRRFDTSMLKNEPLIIKGTSVLTSEKRAIIRAYKHKTRRSDMSILNKIKAFINIVNNNIKHHYPMEVKDEKRLEKFKNRLNNQ